MEGDVLAYLRSGYFDSCFIIHCISCATVRWIVVVLFVCCLCVVCSLFKAVLKRGQLKCKMLGEGCLWSCIRELQYICLLFCS